MISSHLFTRILDNQPQHQFKDASHKQPMTGHIYRTRRFKRDASSYKCVKRDVSLKSLKLEYAFIISENWLVVSKRVSYKRMVMVIYRTRHNSDWFKRDASRKSLERVSTAAFCPLRPPIETTRSLSETRSDWKQLKIRIVGKKIRSDRLECSSQMHPCILTTRSWQYSL